MTKAMVRIECLTLTDAEFATLIQGIRISFGAQTKCRNCGKLRETLTEFKQQAV
jgi:hypothetical protein